MVSSTAVPLDLCTTCYDRGLGEAWRYASDIQRSILHLQFIER